MLEKGAQAEMENRYAIVTCRTPEDAHFRWRFPEILQPCGGERGHLLVKILSISSRPRVISIELSSSQ